MHEQPKRRRPALNDTDAAEQLERERAEAARRAPRSRPASTFGEMPELARAPRTTFGE